MAQFPLAILITLGVLAYLLWPESPAAEEATQVAPEAETVRLDLVLHRLAITSGTPLEKKLVVAPVVQQETSAPKLKVTGAVVAHVPPSPPAPLPKGEGSWDFNTPELASAYSDWLKARADVPFYEKQLEDIQILAAETLKAKKDVADRLEKLVSAGTDPVKDLAAAKADYLQAMAQSQKDDHEAQTNLKNAKRTLATLERQLFQAGMDPGLARKPPREHGHRRRRGPRGPHRAGEKGPGLRRRSSRPFRANLSPAASAASPRRSPKSGARSASSSSSSDPQGRLKPGMFAEIGLGTDVRKTLRIAAEGVLHVGQSDYVLVETEAWRLEDHEDHDGRTVRQPDRGPRRSATGRSRDRLRGHSPEALCRPGRAGVGRCRCRSRRGRG